MSDLLCTNWQPDKVRQQTDTSWQTAISTRDFVETSSKCHNLFTIISNNNFISCRIHSDVRNRESVRVGKHRHNKSWPMSQPAASLSCHSTTHHVGLLLKAYDGVPHRIIRINNEYRTKEHQRFDISALFVLMLTRKFRLKPQQGRFVRGSDFLPKMRK